MDTRELVGELKDINNEIFIIRNRVMKLAQSFEGDNELFHTLLDLAMDLSSTKSADLIMKIITDSLASK